LINPKSDIAGLAELPKNKVRIALPAVCRKPALYSDIIEKLLAFGYKKWEVANWWSLQILPTEKLDISFDSSIYMLNTQAISQAAEIGASQVTLSLEDIKSNVCNIIEKSNIKTNIVIYQDVPLFTSVGCIRDNDCKVCPRGEMWFDMQNKGQKFKALSRDCQMMVFDEKPFCVAAEAKDLSPDYFRADFCYRPYTPQKVADIVNKILEFNNIQDCISGNFLKNNI
jgi:hypothetical protein